MFANKFPTNGITKEAAFSDIEDLLTEKNDNVETDEEESTDYEKSTKISVIENEYLCKVFQCDTKLVPSEGRIVEKVVIRKSLKQLIYSTKKSIHRCSNNIYIESLNRYGKIFEIVKIIYEKKSQVFFRIQLYQQHEKDYETNLEYVGDLSLNQNVMKSVKVVSEPLITSMVEGRLWFLNGPCVGKCEFSWLDSHIEDVSM